MSKKRLKRWIYPHSLESEYKKELKKLAKALQDATLTALKESRFDDVEANRGFARRLLSGVMGMVDSVQGVISGVIEKMNGLGLRINLFNKNQFSKVVSDGYGMESDVIVAEAWLNDALSDWSQENARLIQDIAVDYQRKVAAKVAAAIRLGTDIADLTADIKDTLKIPQNRAELIAVDQTQTLNAQLTKRRQEQIGVKEYRWRGVMDAKERQEHKDREGKIYSWDKAPSDGHPGEPIRCRCWAEMILPELKDLDAILFNQMSI